MTAKVLFLLMVLVPTASASPRSACNNFGALTMGVDDFDDLTIGDKCRFFGAHGLTSSNHGKFAERCPEKLGQLDLGRLASSCVRPYTVTCTAIYNNYRANVREFAYRNRSISDPSYVELSGGLVDEVWLSDSDAECLEFHILKHVSGHASDGGGKIAGFKRAVKLSNEVWKKLSSHQSDLERAREILEPLGVTFKDHYEKVQGFETRKTDIPTPVVFGPVGKPGFKNLPLDRLQPFFDACEILGASPPKIGRWQSFCSTVADAMETQESSSFQATSACNGEKDCLAAFERLRNHPDLESLARCFLTDVSPNLGFESDCYAAYEVLQQSTQELVEERFRNKYLKPLLPILSDPYLTRVLGLDTEQTSGCVVGGGRFLSDQTSECYNKKLFLKRLSLVALTRGCHQGDREACRPLERRHFAARHPQGWYTGMPRFVVLDRLHEACKVEGTRGLACNELIDALPNRKDCTGFFVDYQENTFRWNDSEWTKVLPKLGPTLERLCNEHYDEQVARKSCSMLSAFKRGDLAFGTCGSRGAGRYEAKLPDGDPPSCTKNARRYPWEGLSTWSGSPQNGTLGVATPHVISNRDFHKLCAGRSYGRGDEMDEMCRFSAFSGENCWH